MGALINLLAKYVDRYEFDLKAIRLEYCGVICGDQDLISFTRIYKEELDRWKNARSARQN